MEFHGISPIVTRTQVRHGQLPKLTVMRYSARPDITYDEATNRVVVSSPTCGGSGEAHTPLETSNSDYASTFNAPPTTTISNGPAAEEATSVTSGSTALGKVGPHFFSLLTTAILAQSSPLLAGVWALGSGLSLAQAEQQGCQDVVQILVEAPAAYKGAVDICREEINDPAICPDDFPKYPTCNEVNPSCEVAVIGGGAGGLYAALRMVDEGVVDASDVCVFEITERVGGRLMSLRGLGPEDDLIVDAGGYRTWPEFTPTLHALITEYLGIPMGCYDDSVPCQVFNIVDQQGTKAGFALFVEEMMQRLSDGGACFFPYHELSSFAKISDNQATELYFSNGVVATASRATILNLPQRPLLKVVRESNLDAIGMLDARKLDALHSVQTVIATKLYLYYPRGSVFWRKLGLQSGDFELEGDARNMLLAGRYHDGQVQCDDENDVDTCHGFLLAVYANDLSGNKAQYFRRFQRERPEPVTILTQKDLEGAEFLKHAHDRLVQFHLYNNVGAPYTGFEASQVLADTEVPQFAVLSTWNTAVPWAGGAWHSWTDTTNIRVATSPFAEHGIHVVNEAYSLLHGWAEGSIKVADEILEDHFDIPRPWNFTRVDLNQIVQQTNSQECPDVPEEMAQVEDSRGNGADDISAVLCFTGDALVQMADGTLKPIEEVQLNDEIATGSGTVGRVTETLSHAVDKVVEVAILKTAHGDLVGTPDHPVLQADEWIDFAAFSPESKRERRYIDKFFNLEVDGHLMETSMHSYIVNGIVASGLGDNEELNLRFPRQKEWKIRSGVLEETRY